MVGGFDPIYFTGEERLTRDHLDYHGSMAAYAAAKAKLFKRPELKLAVLNADDALARLMLTGMQRGVRVLAMGRDDVATLRVLDVFPEPLGPRSTTSSPAGMRSSSLLPSSYSIRRMIGITTTPMFAKSTM